MVQTVSLSRSWSMYVFVVSIRGFVKSFSFFLLDRVFDRIFYKIFVQIAHVQLHSYSNGIIHVVFLRWLFALKSR